MRSSTSRMYVPLFGARPENVNVLDRYCIFEALIDGRITVDSSHRS